MPVRKRKKKQQDGGGNSRYKLDDALSLDEQEETIRRYKDKVHNPTSAIRAFCVECMGGYMREVRQCARDPESPNPCSLYPFRMGVNTMDYRSIKARGELDDE